MIRIRSLTLIFALALPATAFAQLNLEFEDAFGVPVGKAVGVEGRGDVSVEMEVIDSAGATHSIIVHVSNRQILGPTDGELFFTEPDCPLDAALINSGSGIPDVYSPLSVDFFEGRQTLLLGLSFVGEPMLVTSAWDAEDGCATFSTPHEFCCLVEAELISDDVQVDFPPPIVARRTEDGGGEGPGCGNQAPPKKGPPNCPSPGRP